MKFHFSLLTSLAIAVILSACSTTKELSSDGFGSSDASAEELIANLPNYEGQLTSLSGKGRALVSEPGNSDRVTIEFEADRLLSLLIIKNRVGIEGGQMLVDRDSILIYNKIDRVAQKISIYDGRLTSLNELASINLLDLINFKVDSNAIEEMMENEDAYRILLKSGTRVTLNKSNGLIRKVEQLNTGSAPYSELIYEGYSKIGNYTLPQKITIFSTDRKSKVAFLVRSLDINPERLTLHIDIPADIEIKRL